MSVYIGSGPDGVAPEALVEVTPLEHVEAFLKKVGSYLTDVRTVAMIATIILGLKTLAGLETEVTEADISATLAVIAAVVLALANLAAVLIPVYKYVDSITKRPSRGLVPWLDEIKAKKAAAAKG